MTSDMNEAIRNTLADRQGGGSRLAFSELCRMAEEEPDRFARLPLSDRIRYQMGRQVRAGGGRRPVSKPDSPNK